MKRFIFTALVVFLCGAAHAQYTSFQLESKAYGTYLSTASSTPTLANALVTDQAATQRFVIKEVGNGNVTIVSLFNPSQCLRRSGSSVTFGTPGSTPGTDYQWQMAITDVEGNDILFILTNPANTAQSLKAQANGTFTLASHPTSTGTPSSGLQAHQFTLVTESNIF